MAPTPPGQATDTVEGVAQRRGRSHKRVGQVQPHVVGGEVHGSSGRESRGYPSRVASCHFLVGLPAQVCGLLGQREQAIGFDWIGGLKGAGTELPLTIGAQGHPGPVGVKKERVSTGSAQRRVVADEAASARWRRAVLLVQSVA